MFFECPNSNTVDLFNKFSLGKNSISFTDFVNEYNKFISPISPKKTTTVNNSQ